MSKTKENQTRRKCDVYAEVCISVMAASPKEAAELFEEGLDKAFRRYDISDGRIHVIDKKTDSKQDDMSEEFDLD